MLVFSLSIENYETDFGVLTLGISWYYFPVYKGDFLFSICGYLFSNLFSKIFLSKVLYSSTCLF